MSPISPISRQPGNQVNELFLRFGSIGLYTTDPESGFFLLGALFKRLAITLSSDFTMKGNPAK